MFWRGKTFMCTIKFWRNNKSVSPRASSRRPTDPPLLWYDGQIEKWREEGESREISSAFIALAKEKIILKNQQQESR